YGKVLTMQRLAGNRAVNTLLQERAAAGESLSDTTVHDVLPGTQSGSPRTTATDRGNEWEVTRDRAVAAAAGPGTPLPADVQRDAESRYGHSFAHVRIHTDEHASRAAASLHASAFTFGRDIVFGPRRYAPGSRHGRLLLQHELRHV